jgi:hypothetical protein
LICVNVILGRVNQIEPAAALRARVARDSKKGFIMRKFLTSAAIVLALAGTSLVVATPASAAGFAISVGNGHDYGRNRSVVSVGFGDVAFGYRDGYWDNGHRWHRWNNSRDYRDYRDHHRGNYYDWNHDRDRDNGWRRH